MPDSPYVDKSVSASATREFAASRDCIIPYFAELAPVSARHWHYSSALFERIRSQIDTWPDDDALPAPLSLLAAGSIGRMEAGALSDLDLVIIAPADSLPDSAAARACADALWQRLAPLGIAQPEPDGIFMRATSLAELTAPEARGDLDYPRHVFGLRMQLLLDAQPLTDSTRWREDLASIIDWHRTVQPAHEAVPPNQFLINELLRYYRSYFAYHHFSDCTLANDSWSLRQAKLQFTRLESTAGLLALCIDCTSLTADCLTLTPIERLYQHAFNADIDAFRALLSLHERLFATLIDPLFRQSLLVERYGESPAWHAFMQDGWSLREQLGQAFAQRLANAHPGLVSWLLF